MSKSRRVYYVNSTGESGSKSSKKASSKSTTLGFNLKHPTKNHVAQTTKPQTNPKKPKVDTYYLTYRYLDNSMSLNNIIKGLNKSVGIIDEPSSSPLTNWRKYVNYYNRFKLPTTNDQLQKAFAHVFFVRPNCNIFSTLGSTNQNAVLVRGLRDDPVFSYAMSNSPELVRELTLNNGKTHDFMLSLSNKASSFSLSDEYINSDTYGKTYTGYKIAFGKNNIESKTAGNFSVTYEDDRYLHIYQLHKLWVEYISGVYRGIYHPRTTDIMNKILDYATCCYYILTAEDNETILFWSKYYGVFPTQIPSEQLSWAKGNLIQNPEITIQYMYSFKEDYNPLALSEFNRNSRVYNESDLSYIPTYDKELGHVGNTWVGAPYIELEKDSTGAPYMYKLRFKVR